MTVSEPNGPTDGLDPENLDELTLFGLLSLKSASIHVNLRIICLPMARNGPNQSGYQQRTSSVVMSVLRWIEINKRQKFIRRFSQIDAD